jgi:hypothetical protein
MALRGSIRRDGIWRSRLFAVRALTRRRNKRVDGARHALQAEFPLAGSFYQCIARCVSLMPRPSIDVFGEVIDERADVRRTAQPLRINDP